MRDMRLEKKKVCDQLFYFVLCHKNETKDIYGRTESVGTTSLRCPGKQSPNLYFVA